MMNVIRLCCFEETAASSTTCSSRSNISSFSSIFLFVRPFICMLHLFCLLILSPGLFSTQAQRFPYYKAA